MVLLMDVGKAERCGSVAQQKSAKSVPNVRSPLVPSGKNNAAPPGGRKLQTREVTSRYKLGIASTTPSVSNSSVARNRCSSPMASRTIPTPDSQLSKRSLSAQRRLPTATSSRSSATQSPCSRPSTSYSLSRPCTPVRDTVAETHNSSKRLVGHRTMDGLWPSMRSLSSSLNLGSVSVPICKKDKNTLNSLMNVTSERKKTPFRGRNASDQWENSRPLGNSHSRGVDQHKRPGILGARLSASAMTRTVDLTDKPSKTSFSSVSLRGTSVTRKSGSDGTGSVLQNSISDGTRRMSLDRIDKADQDVGSYLSLSSNSTKRATSRTQLLPIPGVHCPSSPSKSSLLPSSPSKVSLRSSSPSKTLSRPPSPSRPSTPSASSLRSTASPSRLRPSTPSASSSVSGISTSVISYIVDVRKGKKNANHVENVHQLRLLYNRYLQWRFVNARAEAALSIEKMTTENALYSVWMATSELLDSVVLRKINLQQMRQEIKLDMVLKEQMTHLEEWASLEREHCTLLSGAAEALKASIIRLPVTERARADVLAVKDAISSAVDVMQVMGSSICYLLSRVEGTNSLVSELANVASRGRAMLDECRDLLASIAAMQVQELSLRTQLLQLKQDKIMVG